MTQPIFMEQLFHKILTLWNACSIFVLKLDIPSKMNTKEKLIEVAVRQFNARGVHEVTIRDIAHEVGISSGNFVYHFKNKEALIEHFYSNMYSEVTIDTNLKPDEGFERFNEILEDITVFMTKYRFFYTDIIEIFRMCPAVKKDYSGKYASRKEVYTGILKHFEANGLLEPTVPFDDISHIIWFTMTFWQSQKKVIPSGSNHVQSGFIIWQIWQLLIPGMTEKGVKEYKKLTKKKPISRSSKSN
jgi:AcrR family transcriptional regulator